MYQYPTMHRPVEMNTEVIVPETYLGYEARGRVVGIASIHVIFSYIVLLDQTHKDSDYGRIQAITVGGSHLKNLNGEYQWKFATPEDQQNYLKDMAATHGKAVGSLGL